MIYFLLLITLLGYTFINRVSGLFYGILFYIPFIMLIIPLFDECERRISIKGIKKGIIIFRLKVLSFIIMSTIMGIIYFHWLLSTK